MGELTRTQGRASLRADGVFPYGARLRRVPWTDVALAGAMSASILLGLVSLGAAAMGTVDTGVMPDERGSIVLFVSPTAFAWRDGVRAGDRIVAIRAADERGGWALTVQNSGGSLTTAAGQHDQALRATTPVVILGILLSVAAFVLRSRWRQAAWAAASIGIALSTTALSVQGNPLHSTVGLGSALVVPASALLASRRRSPLGAAVTVGLLAFVVTWAISRTWVVGDPLSLEQVRSTAAFWLIVAGVLLAAIEVRRSSVDGVRRTTSALDLAGVAAFVGLLIVLGTYLYVPPVVLLVVALAAFLAYPRSRRAVLRAADSLVLGDVRRQAAIEASEGERARLAADLHDVPIQELSAVIARLELVPDAIEERAALRRVASQLRAVTTELRPPVLDDLGLPLAIEALAEQYARDGAAIRVDVDDRTLPEAARVPDVELAIYRVTEEAVRNAVTHAAARRIDVLGVIAADSMEIEVRDDGCGLDGHALERARNAGHAGLIAMRQRAEAIGARLSLRSEIGAGVSVIVAWRR
jgi:signal transduction histidine kinase